MSVILYLRQRSSKGFAALCWVFLRFGWLLSVSNSYANCCVDFTDVRPNCPWDSADTFASGLEWGNAVPTVFALVILRNFTIRSYKMIKRIILMFSVVNYSQGRSTTLRVLNVVQHTLKSGNIISMLCQNEISGTFFGWDSVLWCSITWVLVTCVYRSATWKFGYLILLSLYLPLSLISDQKTTTSIFCNYFPCKSGLKQGNGLDPILFNIVLG